MLARMQSILGGFPEDLLLFGKEAPKYFTSSGLVYERERPDHDDEEEEDGEGREEEADGDGKVSLLHPKKTSLAARIRTDDPLFLDFLARLLTMHPEARPTAEQALAHPWLQAKEEAEEGEGEEGVGRKSR